MPPPILAPGGPCLIWSGLLVGSSVAAVAKFRTPDVPRDALLRVGREQFTALRRVEAGVAVAAVASVVSSPATPPPVQIAVGVAVASSAVQGLVIVPLIRREAGRSAAAAGKQIGGKAADAIDGAKKKAHMAQVGLEMLKLLACLYVGSMPM